jgi:hypothetical protein
MMMTVVLLMVALTASAQEVTKGIVKSGNNKVEMSYSFEGGKVTKQYSGTGSASYTYEVEEEATLKFSCSKIKGTESLRIVIDGKDTKGKSTASMNYQVPKGKNSFNVRLEGTTEDDDDNGEYIILPSAIDDEDDFSDLVVEITCKVKKPKQKKTFKVENVKKYLYPHCHQKDSKIRFNDLYGEVSIRCNDEDDDAYEYAELDMEIFENDRIRTKEESGAILGLEDMSTYVIKPESTLIIHTEEGNTSKLEMLVGSMIVNIKKIIEGKSLEVEMNQCVTSINGTIVAFEQKGKESNVWLMAGAVSVKSKKTGKVTKLQPGQRSITGTNGVVQVKSFNIEEGAKKFGIKMSDINNHYSNKTTNTKTTSTTKTAPGKYARYGVKCGIVKRVEATAKERTYTTTWFDDYGRLERIENTKKETKSGSNWVSAANYKFVTIIKDDKQYRLDPNRKRGTSYSLSTITNFIDPNLKLVKGYGVQKTNSKATVDNRQCDVFKGKEAKLAGDATVEHYVWQGIPLKSVEKAPDGTTTTTLQSIELPNSIDASKFEIPKGYTVK